MRLVDVLDRVALLAHGDRERGEPDGTARELLADRAQDLPVEAVEAALVDLQQLQRRARGVGAENALHPHLGVVAHAAQQTVGHARGAAAALRDRLGAALLQRDLEDPRGAFDDRRKLRRGVGLKPRLDAEAVAQRRGEQPSASGCPDQREGRQVERHHARPGALTDGDRQAAILHRRVEGLLQRARQAVDLIDEEHRARLQGGEKRRDVSLSLKRRAGGLHERRPELARDDLRERGLAEPGRPGEQQVVERLPARGGGLDRDRQLLAQPALADELAQPARAQRALELLLELVVLVQVGGLDAGHRRLTPRAPCAAPARSAPRRWRPSPRAAAPRPRRGCSRAPAARHGRACAGSRRGGP